MSEIEKSRALQNRILSTLPRDEYERLAPHAKPCSFEHGDFIYEPNELIEYAYFPIGGMASVLTAMQIRSHAKVGDGIKVAVYADRVCETVADGGEVSLGSNEYVILPETFEQLEDFLGQLWGNEQEY
jgi:hypothetical protein